MEKLRIRGKAFFLTYPQCEATKEAMLEYLVNTHKVHQALVAQEKHEDGNFHLHVFIRFKKELDLRNQAHFDFGTYHPNI